MVNSRIDSYLIFVISYGVVSFGFISNFELITDIAILGIVSGFIALNYTLFKNINEIRLGTRFIYIPLLIIGISIIISNTISGQYIFLTCITVIYYFELYLIIGILKAQILKLFSVIVVLESISVVVIALSFNIRNGGIASFGDYNIAAGILALGSILAIGQKQWMILTIALLGLFFTGAEEAILVVFIVFSAILIRRDFSKKLWVPVSMIALIALLGFYPFEYSKALYAVPFDKLSVLIFGQHSVYASQYPVLNPDNSTSGDYITNGRIWLVQNWLNNFNFFGDGYKLYPDLATDHQIHNIPLIVAQQSGPIAASAWVFVSVYCFIKSHWKYAFIALFALCLFDFFFWCKLGSWWWLLIGLSSFVNIKSDLIFKKVV